MFLELAVVLVTTGVLWAILRPVYDSGGVAERKLYCRALQGPYQKVWSLRPNEVPRFIRRYCEEESLLDPERGHIPHEVLAKPLEGASIWYYAFCYDQWSRRPPYDNTMRAEPISDGVSLILGASDQRVYGIRVDEEIVTCRSNWFGEIVEPWLVARAGRTYDPLLRQQLCMIIWAMTSHKPADFARI